MCRPLVIRIAEICSFYFLLYFSECITLDFLKPERVQTYYKMLVAGKFIRCVQAWGSKGNQSKIIKAVNGEIGLGVYIRCLASTASPSPMKEPQHESVYDSSRAGDVSQYVTKESKPVLKEPIVRNFFLGRLDPVSNSSSKGNY